MKILVAPLILTLLLSGHQARAADTAPAADAGNARETMLCGTNPAYALPVMRSILEEQLQKDHDPDLDSAPPEKLAQEAVEQGITECAVELHKDPTIYAALAPLSGAERMIGWDAYNTACTTHTGSKGACISAEIGAVRALKHMSAVNVPPGARALVQGCELVLKTDPPMAEWRQCVDLSLAVHAPPEKASACKLSVNWHVAKTGAEAGAIMARCLHGG
jgi:hypothetical protein